MVVLHRFHTRLSSLTMIVATGVLLSACSNHQTVVPENISHDAISSVKTELPSLIDSKVNWQKTSYLSPKAKPWWQKFDEPTLHELITVALNNSKDIALVAARLEQAVADARASRSALFPTVTFDSVVGVTSNDLEESGLESNPDRANTASAVFSLDWQADLFGELRSASKSDKATIEAETARLRDAQRLLVSQLVQNYYFLVSLRNLIELTQASIQRRSENANRINELLSQGYATVLDKTRTDSQLYESKATLAQLELDEITLLNQLAVLAGIDLPKTRHLLKTTGSLFVPEDRAPLPPISLLIRHRPDLRAAERDLVAAAYNVNTSIADLYPTLGFQINLGKTTIDDATGSFPALNLITGSVFSNIAMPILGRGRLLAAVDANSARLKQVHLTFEQTAIGVISELDTAIVSMDKNRIIYEQRSLASDTAKEAAELSKELFKAGELDYTSVIVAEQTRVSAENNAISAKQALLNAYIVYNSAVAPVW